MPTIGRVIAKEYKAPLKEVVKFINENRTPQAMCDGGLLKSNGALNKLNVDVFQKMGKEYNATSTSPRAILRALLGAA